ncbi:MAG: L,D-transpeptidase [Ferruginibacter sp.]
MKINYLRALTGTLVASLLFFACTQAVKEEKKAAPKQRKAPAVIGFHFTNPKEWLKANRADFNDTKKQHLLLAVNRIDSAHFMQLDSALIPTDLSGDLEYYLPFPFSVPAISDIKKVIFFSYPAQAFGAYENGELIYAGPTNMGRKKDPTPTGLFYTNWKAEQTTSTFNDEWDLHWNFNIENKLGVGWHQYAMPGYPSSHSCLRLQEWDARYLYGWADQWVLDKKDNIQLKGTPVIVFGSYLFDAPKPWLQLGTDPRALSISPKELKSISAPYLASIRTWQNRRNAEKK